jgi:hypothetical protein
MISDFRFWISDFRHSGQVGFFENRLPARLQRSSLAFGEARLRKRGSIFFEGLFSGAV